MLQRRKWTEEGLAGSRIAQAGVAGVMECQLGALYPTAVARRCVHDGEELE